MSHFLINCIDCRRVVIVEEEVEVEAKVEVEVLGSGRPGRRMVWGGRRVILIYFSGKWH